MEMGEIKLMLFIFVIRCCLLTGALCVYGELAARCYANGEITAKNIAQVQCHLVSPLKGLKSIANHFDHFSTYFRLRLCLLLAVRALKRES